MDHHHGRNRVLCSDDLSHWHPRVDNARCDTNSRWRGLSCPALCFEVWPRDYTGRKSCNKKWPMREFPVWDASSFHSLPAWNCSRLNWWLFHRGSLSDYSKQNNSPLWNEVWMRETVLFYVTEMWEFLCLSSLQHNLVYSAWYTKLLAELPN